MRPVITSMNADQRISRSFQCVCVLLLLAASLSSLSSLSSGQQRTSEHPTEHYDASALPIRAKIHIGGDPDWLASGFGSIWVSVPKLNQIVRIDARANVVQARIKVDQEPCYGIGIGVARAWVLTCKGQSLNRINPFTNQVDLRVPVKIAPEGEGSIAVAGNSVWLVGNEDGHAGTLLQISAADGHTLRKIHVGVASAVVNSGFGAIWVTSSGEGTVYRVNPKTGEVVARIPVAAKPRFTTIGFGSVWVLSQADGTVSQIDPASNTVKTVIPVGVPGSGGDISAGGTMIWVAAAGIPLSRIEPRLGRVVDQYGNYEGADAIRYGFNSVWVSDHRKGDVWRIDPGIFPEY